jgi:hypothetical protein
VDCDRRRAAAAPIDAIGNSFIALGAGSKDALVDFAQGDFDAERGQGKGVLLRTIVTARTPAYSYRSPERSTKVRKASLVMVIVSGACTVIPLLLRLGLVGRRDGDKILHRALNLNLMRAPRAFPWCS